MTVVDDGGGKITNVILPGRTVDVPSYPFESDVIRKAGEQLKEYFGGSRRTFDIPVDPRGTEFQLKVWKELCKVPYGTTVTYGELAVRIGSPRGARAVGMALNRNPVAIIVPCHRVIGSDGSMTGFAGGIDIKRNLLMTEGAL